MVKDCRSELSESICLGGTVTLAWTSFKCLLMMDRMAKCAWTCWKKYLWRQWHRVLTWIPLLAVVPSVERLVLLISRDVASKCGPSCCLSHTRLWFCARQLSWHILLQETSPDAFSAWLNLALGTFPHCIGCTDHWWHIKSGPWRKMVTNSAQMNQERAAKATLQVNEKISSAARFD